MFSKATNIDFFTNELAFLSLTHRNFRYDLPGDSKKLTTDLIEGPAGSVNETDAPPQTSPISLLWQAARCSSAAPTYFKSFVVGKKVFVDGGLLNNNPTLQAYTECTNLIRQLNREVSHLEDRTHLRLVLSLGCSFQSPRKVSWSQIEALSHIRRQYSWCRFYRYLPELFRISGVAKLVKILMDSACDTCGGIDEGIAWASTVGAAFVRFVRFFG